MPPYGERSETVSENQPDSAASFAKLEKARDRLWDGYEWHDWSDLALGTAISVLELRVEEYVVARALSPERVERAQKAVIAYCQRQSHEHPSSVIAFDGPEFLSVALRAALEAE